MMDGQQDLMGPPKIEPETFRKRVLERHDGDTLRECVAHAVDGLWPVVRDHEEPPTIKPRQDVDNSLIAPTLDEKDDYEWYPAYREHQRNAVVSILHELYVEDKDVVELSAPTGAGKSLIIYTTAQTIYQITQGTRAVGRAFVTTPLNTLIDQMQDDEFLSSVVTIKGRSNYSCIHEDDYGTPVDEAICQRSSSFECEYKDQPDTHGGCPYYGRKIRAERSPNVVTNLSFLMANSMIPAEADAGLSPRNLLAIDECQRIEDFALTFIGFTVSEYAVPIDWDEIDWVPGEDTSMEATIEWLRREVLSRVREEYSRLAEKELLTSPEQDRLENLERWMAKVENFLGDVEDHHWTKTHDEYDDKITFEPIFIGRFLDSFLWDQCDKVLLSSATIPKSGFLEGIGLDDRTSGRVEVPSTFPTENRPVATDRAVGKMTMAERDETLPKMADEVARLAEEWSGYKGFAHCHSYKIAERLYDRLPQEVKRRTRLQDGNDREGSLDAWKDAPVGETGPYRDTGGQLFLSVGQEEGISLDDDLCRWQVVVKCAYPFMGDERVSYRMDSDTMGGSDWTWYASSAAVALQQAAGRAVRSKEDWAMTYLLDSSLLTLVNKNGYLFEDWFLDAVDEEPCEEIESALSVSGSTGDDSLDSIAQKHFGGE